MERKCRKVLNAGIFSDRNDDYGALEKQSFTLSVINFYILLPIPPPIRRKTVYTPLARSIDGIP